MNKYFKKIIEHGLYIIVFLLSLQARLFIRNGEIEGGFSEYLTISLYGVDILLLIIILLNGFIFLRELKAKKFDFKISKLLYLIGGLDLIVFISIFFAEDKILALYKYSIFLLGIGLFWLIAGASYNKAKLLWSFLAGIILQTCLGIWQFLMQSSFANKWLGLAMHDSSDLGVSVIEVIGSDGVWERWLRAYGGFDHPNILGGVMAIGLLVLLNLYLKNSNLITGQSGFQKIKQYLLLTAYILMFMALIFSFSRAAWLGFIVGIIILSFILVIQKKYYQQKELLIIILISVALTSLIYSQYSNLFQTRLSINSRLENISYAERVSSINDSKIIIKDNFLFGTGIGNYALELDNNTINSHPSWYYQPVHNAFLLVWSELGIFGLLFFALLLVYLLFNSYKNKKYFNIVIILSLITIMMFDHWWWSLHFGVLFWWFVMGMVYRDNKFV